MYARDNKKGNTEQRTHIQLLSCKLRVDRAHWWDCHYYPVPVLRDSVSFFV